MQTSGPTPVGEPAPLSGSAETLTSSWEQQELERIRAAYDHRKRFAPPGRYARSNPFHLYSLHEREAAMARLLRGAGLASLAGVRILDVGCGRGDTLRQLLDYGAEPALLFGVDLLEEHVEHARRLGPHLRIVCANAAHLPFADSSFDLVLQFTLFTSVLSDGLKQAIAAQIRRVLRRRGTLLWYDFAYDNPKNNDVRGIGKAEIRGLFPGFPMRLKRITLAPPLGRAVAPLSPALYYLLAQFRPLCTHYLCLLEKP